MEPVTGRVRTSKVSTKQRFEPFESFEVTVQQTIATIVPADETNRSLRHIRPHEAAFLAIVNHDEDGTFSFQQPGSPRVTVTVKTDHEEPPTDQTNGQGEFAS